MDPWQGQRKEPKAPDKNIEALNPKDSNIIMKIKPENQFPACGKTDNYSPRVVPSNKDSSVSSLNEPDLKALLEEAMAYKRPKDIQGKSELFKELLHSVECEKKYSVMSRSEKQGTRKPRRKQVNKKEATEKPSPEGHFQDLIVHVSECDVSTKRQVKYSLKCSPTNVPQVVPVNAVTVCDENNPEVAALLQNGSFENLEQIQQFIANEANVYQIQPKDPVDNRVGFPLTISPYGEKPPEEVTEPRISVKDIATLTGPPRGTDSLESSVKDNLSDSKKSLDENGNAVGTSRIDNLTERKSKARRLKAKNDKNTILSQHIEGHRSDIAQDIDALMKYIESPKNADSKAARQRNSVGYSKQSSRIGNKIAPVRDKSSDTFSRKTQKNKEDKIHKSSSLEEVSISKFEDLTQTLPASDDKNKAAKKSSNDKNSGKPSMVSLKNDKELRASEQTSHLRNDKTEQETIDADFLPVTKKNRKKKLVYENSLRNKNNKAGDYHRSEKVLSSYMRKSQELDGFHAPSREFQRRKSISSVPSSDKSGDTSDMDSVHSFPVSSSKGKGMKSNVSVSSGSTPQISYADIARSVPSPTRTDLSPKCKINLDQFGDYEEHNFSPQEPIPTVIFQLPTRKESVESSIKSREEYPPLENKTSEKNVSQSDLFVEYTMVVPKRNSTAEASCVNVEETVLIEMPPTKRDNSALESSNLVIDNQLPIKRPPVILMNSSNETNDINDLVFGFEVNEQLLSNSEKIKNCDLVSIEPNEARISVSNLPVDQDNSESRKPEYREHPDDSDSPIPSPQYLKLVEYVTSEWRAVQEEFKSGSGRVAYYRP